MAIRDWRLSHLAIVGIAGVCVEFWAIRTMLRMETRYPALAGVDTLPADNPFRDIPLRADLRWGHFALEALVFAVIPAVVLFIAWRWFSRKRGTPNA